VERLVLKKGWLMTDFLPPLLWKPSPNFSSRGGARVDLIVLHDCEGSYESAVRWFETSASKVSAHYVIREDGDEATQMVELSDNAWHACAFNRRSVGIEMGGLASRGFGAPLLTTAARMVAYLCHHLQIPVRHARAGVGPGIASHHDLGAAGGGHHDPSDDPAFMEKFLAMVDAEYRQGQSPEVWAPSKPQSPCLLSPGHAVTAPTAAPTAPPGPDVHTISGLQQALTMLGWHISVDGDYGPQTREAVASFQTGAGLVADGIAGAQTEAELLKHLSLARRSDVPPC
jgi:N-acetyl-anhydromuramyl-L-alanine amidase AmpD